MSKAEQHAVTEEEEKRALKKATLYPMLFHTIQGVVQHLITLQTEPILMRELCNGDVAEASRMLGATAGAAGVLGLLVNQVGGKLSDSLGRKPFYLLGPLVNVVLGLVVYLSTSKSKWLLVSCRMIRMIVTTFSGTVMTSATLNDIYRHPHTPLRADTSLTPPPGPTWQ